MTIRVFRARTAAAALAQVKQELGRQAVILNTRTYRTGGFFGVGGRMMTEITASDRPPEKRRDGSASTAARAPRQPVAPPAPVPSIPPPAAEPSMKEVARMIVAATAKTPIEDELAAIKRMVGQVLQSSRVPGQTGMPEALFERYRRMLESAVASDIAGEIAGQVRDELTAAQLRDPEAVRAAVLARLASLIPVAADGGRGGGRTDDGRPLTIALVGPTGVGKTTTIAKLAATYRLRQGRKVGLITCDTYRIAAVDQLRTYAGIINIPLKVAMTPSEMRSACASLADSDVILIDSAGRAPRDEARLGELRSLIAAASPHQTHLVLSSAAAEASLLDAAARFAPLGCDRVILTKLDEAVSFGVVVNVLTRLSARLSFITTGQEVPDHIEPINPDRMARLVLGTETIAR